MKNKALLIGLLLSSFVVAGCSNGGKTVISTPNAPAAIGPYNQAVVEGNTVYCSGQIALDPTTGLLVGDGVASQTHQVFKNLKAVLEAANSCLDNALKTTVFLVDMNDFNEMNEVYKTYFSEGKAPARSAIEVAALPKNALVEIELVAYIK